MMTLNEITAAQLQGWLDSPEVNSFAEVSSHLIVALWDGQPTCFVGLITLPGNVAYIWMHTLPLTRDHRVATARHARDLIHRAKNRYRKIVGHCNADSRRWLATLGATLLPDGVTFEIV